MALSHQNNVPAILSEFYILFAISLATVISRVIVRMRYSKGWGWDDTFIIIALACLAADLGLMHKITSLGFGRHIYDLKDPETQILEILKFNTFFQMVNVLCTLFTKYSICFFILRIRDSRGVRWVLGASMAAMTVVTLAVIVVLSVSCHPLKKLWMPETPGTCLPLTTVYNVAYVHSGFTIVVDLCLTTTPAIILWNVRVERGRKTFICFLMSLGLIATISNALRNVYQKGLTSKDMTFAVTPVIVVAILELTSGIIAACVPACVPLWRRSRAISTVKSNYAHGSGPRTGFTKSSATDTLTGSVHNYEGLEEGGDTISMHRLTNPTKETAESHV